MDREKMDPWESVWVAFRHADLYPCNPDWHIPPYTPSCDGLFFIRKGEAWVGSGGERFDAKPGDLFVIRSGVEFSAGHQKSKPLTVYSTGFNLLGPGNSDALRPFALPVRLRLRSEDCRALETIFATLVSHFHDAAPSGKLAARGALLQLLAETLRLSNDLPAERKAGVSTVRPGDATRASAVTQYVNDNLDQPLTLDDLAKRAHLSPVYFSALFRKQTGQAPMAFLRARRIEVARARLASSDETIENIARRVGFADPFHFSRVFRQIVGLSPRAYREKFKNPFA
jgi:AraC-like DNA-binding protein